jgi:hypothetical protein
LSAHRQSRYRAGVKPYNSFPAKAVQETGSQHAVDVHFAKWNL